MKKRCFNPLVPGDFSSSNFFTKLGGKVQCMNRLGHLEVQSRHSIFDHTRGKKKSVLQSKGGLYPQLHLLNYDTPLPALLPAAYSAACSTPPCQLPCLLCNPLPAPMPVLRPPACSTSSCLLPCLLLCYPLPATLPALRPLPAL